MAVGALYAAMSSTWYLLLVPVFLFLVASSRGAALRARMVALTDTLLSASTADELRWRLRGYVAGLVVICRGGRGELLGDDHMDTVTSRECALAQGRVQVPGARGGTRRSYRALGCLALLLTPCCFRHERRRRPCHLGAPPSPVSTSIASAWRAGLPVLLRLRPAPSRQCG